VLRRILIDFSHGQEKISSQEEDRQQEKTNPEKEDCQNCQKQKEIGGREKTFGEGKAGGEEEAGREEEIGCKESHATRGNYQSSYSQRPPRSGS